MKQTRVYLVRPFFLNRLQAAARGTLCRITVALFATMVWKISYADYVGCHNLSQWQEKTTVLAPANISVQADAKIGTRLTGWIVGPSMPNVYKCSSNEGGASGVIKYGGKGTLIPKLTIDNAPVYTTNLAGIGVALRAQVWVNQTWGAINAGQNLPILATHRNKNDEIPVGAQVSYLLVKTATGPVQPGNLLSDYSNLQLYPAEYGNVNVPAQYGGWKPSSFWLSTVAIAQGTCTAEDVSVTMGDISGNAFKGKGSTAGAQSFSITLKNCPTGYKAIQYTLNPRTDVIIPNLSVIELNKSGAPAKGVGLQLRDKDGKPVPLKSAVPFSPYAPGTLSIPLNAAYYQIDDKITAGEANAAVEFTITYQ